MVAVLQKRFGFEMKQGELESWIEAEEDRVIITLETKAVPCAGSKEILAKLRRENNYKMAVVSSSALRRIRASLFRTGQDKYFDFDEVYSAATSLPKPTSKPDPAIYLHVLARHGAEPGECVAVEDSLSGATAAVRAKIPLIGYVGSYHTEAKRQEIASKLQQLGCKAIMHNWSDFEKCLAQLEADEA